MTDVLLGRQPASPAATNLQTRLDTLVLDSPYLSGRRVTAADEECVVLEGTVSSYFHKQMAQETLLRVDGVRRIDNRLQVAKSPLAARR